jgi:hypothetical protein
MSVTVLHGMVFGEGSCYGLIALDANIIDS